MFLILLNWLIVMVVCLSWGYSLAELLQRKLDKHVAPVPLVQAFLWGLIALAVLGSAYQAFFPANPSGLLVAALAGLGLALACRVKVRMHLSSIWQAWKQAHVWARSLLVLLFAMAMLKSASLSEIQDETAYHLPFIRWMECYPLTPGIANIEDRLGFNPSKYLLDAFFSTPFLFEGGLYDLNALIFLVLGAYFLFGFNSLLKGKTDHLYSGLIRAASLFFLWRAYLTSMDADFLNIYGGLFWLALAVRRTEEKRSCHPDSEMVFFFAFFAFLLTNKFSIGLLGWLPLGIGVVLLRHRHYKALGWAVIPGLLILLPWFARNYVISGYLAYPLYFLDWFKPDWKVPESLAQGQYRYVMEFARLEIIRPFNDYPTKELDFGDWIGAWTKGAWAQWVGKAIMLGLPVSLLLALALPAVGRLRRSEPGRQLLWMTAGLVFSAAMWFWRIPAIRFGWPWLLCLLILPPALLFYPAIVRFRKAVTILVGFLLTASLSRGVLLSVSELPAGTPWYLYPNRVESPEGYEVGQLNGINVIIAPDNFCGGLRPPCLPRRYHPGLQARGEEVADGFRIIEK